MGGWGSSLSEHASLEAQLCVGVGLNSEHALGEAQYCGGGAMKKCKQV